LAEISAPARAPFAPLVPLLPGIALALALALAGEGVARATGWPATPVALLLGIMLHPYANRDLFRPGLVFCVKQVLRWGVARLGLRIALSDILGLGPSIAGLVVVAMILTLLLGVALSRALGRGAAYGALAGGATAVCGASAALAISTVLPPSRERDADTAYVVIAVNALSTLAMVAYPLLGAALGFDERTTGIFLGATIHDVVQVVGAGYSVSETAGNAAVLVKLFRVFLLLPVVLAVGYAFARSGREGGGARVPVPVFALVFLALVLVSATGLLPQEGIAAGLFASKWFLAVALAGLGLQTSLKMILGLGWHPMAVVTGATLAILAVTGAGLLVLR
jgi:uncharacterized integral membrane protein (TIGR00698 family)